MSIQQPSPHISHTTFKLLWEGARKWKDWEVRALSVNIPDDKNDISATFNQIASDKKVQPLQLQILEDSWATCNSASGFVNAFQCTTEQASVMKFSARILRVKETGNSLEDIPIEFDERPAFLAGSVYHVCIQEKDHHLIASFKKSNDNVSTSHVHFLSLRQDIKKALEQKISDFLASRMSINEAEEKASTVIKNQFVSEWSQKYPLEEIERFLIEADSPTVCWMSDYHLSCMFEHPIAVKCLRMVREALLNTKG